MYSVFTEFWNFIELVIQKWEFEIETVRLKKVSVISEVSYFGEFEDKKTLERP